jgi:glutamate-1-semialdehyde 2,1-aminomutase
MERMNPMLYSRPEFSFHGGTFTGNPVTLTAGLQMLKILENGQIIRNLNNNTNLMKKKLQDIFESNCVDAVVNSAGSLFHVHFTKDEVKNAVIAFKSKKDKLVEYHSNLINNGIFFLPTKTGAISNAHSKEDLDKVIIETERYAKKLNQS